MPKTHIARSKIINASIEKVYDAVADLSQWEAWSPWLIMEPDAKVTVADDKQSYSWTGERVGEGHMVITSATENQSVRYDLNFIKPWKSYAAVGMDLRETGGGTEVTWTMDSSLPFFMFWMKKMMETFVGMDYERGLTMLKDYAELGTVQSKLNFLGESEYLGSNYVGIKRACSIEDMPDLMGADFEVITAWAAENGLDPSNAIGIYHDFNVLKGRCAFTSAVRYDEKPDNIPAEFTVGTQAPAKLHSVEHVGAYHHLGNAWSTMHNMIQSKSFKPIKNYHPFETYGNSPADTKPEDLRVTINFAVK